MRRARLAIAFFFFADGLLLGSWATRIPAVQRQADVTTTQLGLALFAASLGALVAMPLAGWIGARVGSRRVTTVALVGGAGSLVVVSLAGDLAALAVGLFGFGAGFGAINVAANAQGLALEARYGRAILSTFHAAFSGGALAGAAGGALTAAFGVGPQPHFGALALAVAVGGVAGSRWLLPPNSNAEPSDRTLVRPPRSVLVLGAAAFLTLLAEGAAVDWSAVYLSDSVGASAGAAALGYTAFSLAMVVSRLCGDRINERAGPVTLVRAGGLIAASGLAVALAGGSTALALVGLSSMGAGLGVIVPVLFRAAGTAPGLAAGSGVAVVSSIGWLGFLAGPPAIGFAAGTFGLRNALWLVVAAAAGLALIARSVEPRPRSAFRGLLLEPRAVLSDLDGVLVDSGARSSAAGGRSPSDMGSTPIRFSRMPTAGARSISFVSSLLTSTPKPRSVCSSRRRSQALPGCAPSPAPASSSSRSRRVGSRSSHPGRGRWHSRVCAPRASPFPTYWSPPSTSSTASLTPRATSAPLCCSESSRRTVSSSRTLRPASRPGSRPG